MAPTRRGFSVPTPRRGRESGPDPWPLRQGRGFTLIELLMVMAVIAIIAGVLLTVLSRARESARQRKCAHNLGQLGHGFMAYAEDWRGSTPPGRRLGNATWYIWTNLQGTVGELSGFFGLGNLYNHHIDAVDTYVCPSHPFLTLEYLMEGWPENPRRQRPWAASSFLYRYNWDYVKSDLTTIDNWSSGLAVALDYPCGSTSATTQYPHGGRFGNIVYADAHVEGRRADWRSRDYRYLFEKLADRR